QGGVNVDYGSTFNGVLDGGANNAIKFGAVSTGEGIGSKRTTGGNQFGLDFYTGYVSRLSITSPGNVGIGTSTPGQKLSIQGGVNVDYGSTFNGVLDGGANNAIKFGATNTGEGIGSKRTTGGNQFGLDFYTGYVSRLSITSPGNVGIGTSAPTQKLHVVGNFRCDSPDGGYFSQSSSDGGLDIASGNDNQSYIDFKGSANLSSDFMGRILYRDSDGFYVSSNGPNTFNVNGRLRAKEIKVELGGLWADYVFAQDYCLRPLAEVEQYIKEHQHLPNIPSATTVETEGIEIASMVAKQMEKIEELTLYMIDMDKKLAALQNENEQLKIQISSSSK
ncbi:MAG TPA: hypothetical protein PK230_04705, partial [Chitinophagales bacterium]|nr:hypothetical protein [Chitinophagales bacterium]